MFDIGWQELLVIAIILIVVVGPKDLPRMLRAFGKTTSRMRSMASDFRSQFDEALREADLDDVRKTISDAQDYNPSRTIRDAMSPLKQVGEDIRAGLADVVKPETVSKPAEDDSPAVPPSSVAETGATSASTGAGTAEPAKPAKTSGRKTAATSSRRATKPKAPAAAKKSAKAPPAKATSARGVSKSGAAKAKAADGGDAKSGKATTGTGGGTKRKAPAKPVSKARPAGGKSAGSRRTAAKKPAGKTEET